MEPMFGPGDLVIARSDLDPHVGDVVLAEVNGGMVLHRLVARDADGEWRTKGDANRAIDGWRVTDDDIVGRVWVIVPSGGDVLIWVAAHPLTSAWIAAVLSVLIGWPWRATWRATSASGCSPTRP